MGNRDLPKKEFDKFQKEFTKYQKLFGLTGYKVYFRYEPLEGCYADITSTQSSMVSTARLNSELSPGGKSERNVKSSAKHEACHLLLSKLDSLARSRFIRVEEIEEVCEEIVHKLEMVIP